MKVYCIYVSAKSEDNFRMTGGVWGIRSSSIDRRIHTGPGSPTGRQILAGMAVGDAVLFGFAGPPSRVDVGHWSDVMLREGHLTRVKRPYYQDSTPRWPDDVYEHRWGFEPVGPPSVPLTKADFGTGVLEALRISANSYGLPVASPVDDGIVLARLNGKPGASVALEGELDRLVSAIARAEQAKLRAGLLAGATVANCVLCGGSFHKEHLVAAHIKRRSVASPTERLNAANAMLNCRFGCDNLFEHGYIAVDGNGTIVRNPVMPCEPAEDQAVTAIEGRHCAAHSAASEAFFAWHRSAVAGL